MLRFFPDFEKPGPGVDENAPPKTGLARYGEILVQKFWHLLKLNFLFCVSALPLLTLGPALYAMTRCTMHMVRGRPIELGLEYRDAFREGLHTAFLPGVLQLALQGWLLVLALSSGNPLVQALALGGQLLLGMFLCYFWPMAATVDLPMAACARNALLLCLARPQHAVPAALVCTVILGVHILFFPLSLPAILFLPFGLSSVTACFAAWSDIRRLVVQEPEK